MNRYFSFFLFLLIIKLVRIEEMKGGVDWERFLCIVLVSLVLSVFFLEIQKLEGIELTLTEEIKEIVLIIVGVSFIFSLIGQIVWAYFVTKKWIK